MKMADTSYCIDYLRDNLTRLELPEFELALSAGQIAINPVVWVELTCGTRSKREEKHLSELLDLTKLMDFDQDTWQKTSEIARICHNEGANVPLSDIQIKASAIRHNLELLHHDNHFFLIEEAIIGNANKLKRK